MKQAVDQSSYVLVFGRKGTGKTTWIKKSIVKNRGKKTFVIIDTQGNFDYYGTGNIQQKLPDFNFQNPEQLFYHLKNNVQYKEIIRFDSTDYRSIVAAMVACFHVGNICLVVDEGHSFFGQSMENEIKEIVLRGRNRSLDIIAGTLRPHKLNIDLRSNADIIVCFSMVGKHAIKSLQDEFGEDELNIIEELHGHEYIKFYVDQSKIEVFKRRHTGKEAVNNIVLKKTG